MERAKNPVPYLDMPIQHMSPTVLRRMGRKETPFSIIETIVAAARLAEDHVSTVMVGFPGRRRAISRRFDSVWSMPNSNASVVSSIRKRKARPPPA